LRAERAYLVHLLRLNLLADGARVLEVASGAGVYQELLRHQLGMNGQLVALDLSAGALAHSAGSGRATQQVQANAEFLPFENASFDAVFHFGAIKHFEYAQRAVNELVRVAKPGAVVAYGDMGWRDASPSNWRRAWLKRFEPAVTRPRPNLPKGMVDVTEYPVYGGLGYLMVGKRFQALRAPFYMPSKAVALV
jgi:ubiquinone/menaquinone biosynthesis C-methylase UbiE